MPATTLHLKAKVLPGKRIEIISPELEEGEVVDVQITLAKPEHPRMSMLEFLDTLPPGPRTFDTWEEYDRHLKAERDAWDR